MPIRFAHTVDHEFFIFVLNTLQSNDGIMPVSRDEAAQVCVSALLDPQALNKIAYMSKKSGGGRMDEDLSAKFAALEGSNH